MYQVHTWLWITMTWEWPISSKTKMPIAGRALCLAAGLLWTACGAIAASVSGSVQLTDAGHGGNAKNAKDGNVVVWLKAVGAPAPPMVAKHARMLQQDKKFTPHLLAIRMGTSVDFPNLDPIFHNAFSNFNGKIFDLSLYAPGTSRAVRFDLPGVVRIFCNIHPAMSAVIVVIDSPYFVTTPDSGKFSIPDVADGEYEIHFFHERATPETLERLTRHITVKDNTALSPVVISEAGYLPVAHTNKYGREYPKDSDNGKNYSLPVK
jgi:plastocyanin